MSDAGKVMVDSSGRPLAGVGGIVLADRLYPYSLGGVVGDAAYWNRYLSSVDMAADGILDVDWESGGVSLSARRMYWPSLDSNTARHRVFKIDLSWKYASPHEELSAPWGQIQPLSLPYEVSFEDGVIGTDDYANPQNVNGYVWYSWADQDDPSGHEEVWLRDTFPYDWTELRMGKPQDDGSERVLTGSITIPKSPSPPAQLWIAEFFDSFTPNASLYGTDGYNCIMSLSLSFPSAVKYNLAT